MLYRYLLILNAFKGFAFHVQKETAIDLYQFICKAYRNVYLQNIVEHNNTDRDYTIV